MHANHMHFFMILFKKLYVYVFLKDKIVRRIAPSGMKIADFTVQLSLLKTFKTVKLMKTLNKGCQLKHHS